MIPGNQFSVDINALEDCSHNSPLTLNHINLGDVLNLYHWEDLWYYRQVSKVLCYDPYVETFLLISPQTILTSLSLFTLTVYTDRLRALRFLLTSPLS